MRLRCICGSGQGYCHVSYCQVTGAPSLPSPTSLLCFKLPRPCWSPSTTLSLPLFLSLLSTLLCLLCFLSSLDSLRSRLIWTVPPRPPFLSAFDLSVCALVCWLQWCEPLADYMVFQWLSFSPSILFYQFFRQIFHLIFSCKIFYRIFDAKFQSCGWGLENPHHGPSFKSNFEISGKNSGQELLQF